MSSKINNLNWLNKIQAQDNNLLPELLKASGLVKNNSVYQMCLTEQEYLQEIVLWYTNCVFDFEN